MSSMSPQQDRFIAWLLTLKAEREPSSQDALCKELGLPHGKLTEWRRDPDFLEAWNNRYLRTIGSPETKMEIVRVLQQTATDPDDPKHIAAAKAYFEIEGSLRPQKNQVDIKVSGVAPSDLTDEELERLLASKAGDELGKRREAG